MFDLAPVVIALPGLIAVAIIAHEIVVWRRRNQAVARMRGAQHTFVIYDEAPTTDDNRILARAWWEWDADEHLKG